MSTPIEAVVALGNGVGSLSVEPFLSEAEGVRVLGYANGTAQLQTVLEQRAAELVLVVCNSTSTTTAALIEESVRRRPDTPVVVLQLGPADVAVGRELLRILIAVHVAPDPGPHSAHRAGVRGKGLVEEGGPISRIRHAVAPSRLVSSAGLASGPLISSHDTVRPSSTTPVNAGLAR